MNGEAIITKLEILNSEHGTILSLLKEKGAPIIGAIELQPDVINYKWWSRNLPDGSYQYEWKKRA